MDSALPPELEREFWGGIEADVLELIRAAGAPRDLAEQPDPSVREKYIELWTAAQQAPDE